MAETIKILMIDDDEEDFIITNSIIKSITSRRYRMDWVSSYSEGLSEIRKNVHDVYLVDFRLGAETGLNLIAEALRDGSHSPFILMTGQDDIRIDELAMETGALDYLVKGNVTPQQLERSLRYSMQQARTLRRVHTLNVQLEERVRERTEKLQNALKELQQSKVELEEALVKEKDLSELKSRFVTMASHEFRTPLATILSSATLLGKYCSTYSDGEKCLKHIDRIKSSVSNLTDILNDILSLGKLEEGKVNAVCVDADINEVMKEVIAELQEITLDGQQIVYKGVLNGNAYFDHRLLKNIVINLVSNAIKFSPPGKDITIEVQRKSSGILFSVKDEGMGIPYAEQAQLFQRFFRASNALNVKGTGLGLNIVKKYIELMNGDIRFTSEPGNGTTFIVELPQPVTEIDLK